tara:strand:- start:2412 stop:3134 length:723 start_codon:yes stop_codon:yes gene_type:complete
MPNWCYNTLTVETPDRYESTEEDEQKDRAELLKFKKENFRDLGEDCDEQVLTFQGTVPMPDTLRITSGSTTDRAIAYVLATTKEDFVALDKIINYQWAAEHYGFKDTDEINLKRVKTLDKMKTEVKESEIEEADKALLNEKLYGHKDWYNWSIDNWGTKWDASNDNGISHQNKDELCLGFDTAWAPPIPWLQKVTDRYKRLKFTLEYQEEGMGFEGKAFAREGELVDNSCNVDYPDSWFD